MSLNELLLEVRNKVSNGDTEGALKEMSEALNQIGNEVSDQTIILSNRLERINKERLNNTISYEEVNREISKINQALLELLKEIPEREKKKPNENFINDVINLLVKFSIEIEKIKFDYKNIESAINFHLIECNNWSKSINIKESAWSKLTAKVYVELKYLFSLRRTSIDIQNESTEILNINSIIEQSDNHLIIYGLAGAGKTTTMKKVTQDILSKSHSYIKYNFPIVIRLRELNNNKKDSIYPEVLFERIFSLLGIAISFKNKDKTLNVFKIKKIK